MTFRFGQGWVYQGEAGDETTGAAGGAGTGAPAGEGEDAGGGEDDGGAGAGAAGGEADPAGAAGQGDKGAAPKDMKSAIDAALGYTKEGADPGDKKSAAAKPAEKKPGAAGAGETETQHANGAPKKDAKGNELDADGKVTKAAAPAKARTAAELDLKPEEKKALGAKAQARFGEVIGALKERETAIATLTAQMKPLQQARADIQGILHETNTTPEQLSAYLEYNRMRQSGNAQELETALAFIERQRAQLYAALGREPQGGGIDLLQGFDDLKKAVEDDEMTRERALELARLRRNEAARTQAAQRQQNQQRTAQTQQQQYQQASNKALGDIEAWTAQLQKGDLDYKAKEDKLLAEIDEVVKNYPPAQWLPTLKLLYKGIAIQKASSVPGGPRPLRPSGAKAGDKAPASMLDAINQGLGYATAEKG